MADLAAYRTRITNSLDDTSAKYSNTVMDEALRKVLNEYTRASPNFKTLSHTVVAAGREQALTAASNLIVIVQLVHPYNSAAADPYQLEREDYTLVYMNNIPTLFFYGGSIPQVGEKIYIKYASTQTIEDLDSATATTVRDDHEDILVLGASGQAAMMRASGINEQWGGRSGEMSGLMTWGKNQYSQFLQFLEEIKQEAIFPIFPESFWKLDEWDGN